jgi:rubrerythrin
MLARMTQFKCVLCAVLFIVIPLSFSGAQSNYPETIAVFQTAYQNEIQAHVSYLAYAQKALSENYPNIAHLFGALASSESIHARNFKQCLSDLNIEVREPKTEIKVSSTKENLKNATQVELQEIDQRYPQFVEKIRSEKHEVAIRNLTYAWESEKQHRDLIEKIRSGTGFLFGLLASRIEDKPFRYFVCQTCGSTIREPPKEACPICGLPASQYKEIERIK